MPTPRNPASKSSSWLPLTVAAILLVATPVVIVLLGRSQRAAIPEPTAPAPVEAAVDSVDAGAPDAAAETAPPGDPETAAESPGERDTLAEVEAFLQRSREARPLRAEELSRIKRATVLVFSTRANGSGFVLRHGGKAYVATNFHVAHDTAGRPRPGLEIVLDSGTPSQLALDAEVVAADRETDLALLGVQRLPSGREALPLAARDNVFETQPVVIAGFPFGSLLERKRDTPSPTISTGTVSSLRYDDTARLVRVQLDADLNPGNSGGPVLDYGGDVVGVAVEEVTATSISFMIPVSALTRLLTEPRADRRASTPRANPVPPSPGRWPGRAEPAPAVPKPDWLVRVQGWQRPAMDRPLALGEEMKERGRLQLRSVLTGLTVLPAAGRAVVLNASDSEVVEIDLADLRSVKTAPLPRAFEMSVSPSGKSIYVAGKTTVGAQDASAIYRLNAALATVGSVTIPNQLLRLAGDDSGLVFVVQPRERGILAVSMAQRRVVVEASSLYSGSYVHLFPDQNRLYAGTVGLSPGDFHCVLKTLTSRGKLESYDSRYHGDYPLGDEFAISPDGRYLFAYRGPVLRLGGSKESDLAYVASLPPFASIAFSPHHSVFFVAFTDGTVAAYSMDDFSKPLRSYHIGWVLHEMILDPAHEQIVGLATPPSESEVERRYPRRERKAGNLLAFSYAP